MSEKVTEDRPARAPGRGIFKSRFLIISILFHVLLALVATYLVIQTLTPRKQTFKAAATSPDTNKSVEHRVQVAKKQQSMSAPPMKRIATTGLSKVALPEMPDVAPAQAPGTMQGLGMVGSPTGLGGMQGATGGGGGGASIPLFGLRTGGTGLPGTFYDFKQTRSGHPSEFAVPKGDAGKYQSPDERKITASFGSVVDRFIKGGFNRSLLTRYFIGPIELYATQIWIPWMDSEQAPKEFDLAGKVDPRRWIIVYEGRVIPPQDGTYTLAGFADDIIAVRVDGHNVLGEGAPKATYAYNATQFQHAKVGEPFTVKGGVPIPISIVIGERPGGKFGAYLLIQKEGVSFKKDKAGNPILPLFKFAPGRAPKSDRTLPPFANDTGWSVWKLSNSQAGSTKGLLP